MLFLIIIPCILCFVYAWRRRRRYLQGRLPPTCSLSWPIIGLAHLWARGSFWDRLLNIQTDCLKKGGVTLLYSGINPTYSYYAICDPEETSKIGHSCLQRTFLLEDSIKELLGESLVTVSVPIWESRRKFLEAFFDELNQNVEVVNQQSSLLIEELEVNIGTDAFDHKIYMQRVVMRILNSIVFGMRNDDDDFGKNVDLCIKTMDKITSSLYQGHSNVFMHNKMLFNCSRLKRMQTDAINVLKDLIKEIVETKKVTTEINSISNEYNKARQSKGLADVLMELEGNGVYTEDDVRKELTAMIFSGYDTMTAALTCVLYLVGSNPGVQEKLNDEITNTFNGKPDVQMDEVAKLVYLEAVILETLRLYSPVPMVSRCVHKDIQLKKYKLEAGSKCLLGIYGVNRHSTWGEDREEFRPLRWLDHAALTENMVAFGVGKRNCIAKKFALHAMKLILVNLLRKYNVSTNGGNMQMKQEIFLTPVDGYHIILKQKSVPV